MHSLDLSIFNWFYGFAGQGVWSDRLIVFIAERLIYALLLWFVYLVARAAWREEWRSVQTYCRAVISALVARFVVAEAIRFFYHHPRPFVALGLHSLFNETSYSFPSGHAIFLFALSTGVYMANKRQGRIFYFASFIICLARIAAGVHYPSDILGGMILGILTAYCVERAVSLGKS